MTLPKFDELPVRPGAPKAAAWGVWGDEDEFGTLNHLTSERVKEAMNEVRHGETIPLNMSLDGFVAPMNPVRKACDHHIIAKGHANDDEIHINTQGSSHWDGPRHFPYQETLQYYNGATQEDITGPKANHKVGVQNLARKTITGRGVLVDWYSWAQTQGIKIDHFATHAIPLSQVEAAAETQGSTFRPGDILFVRTGWMQAYQKLSIEQRKGLPNRKVRSSCGFEASEEAIRWHWDNQFAAVASDTVAYEAWPSPKPWGVAMHEVFLGGWAMPIGESFDLEQLAKRCKEEKKWSFFLVSVPLDLPGGIASPPGAVAII